MNHHVMFFGKGHQRIHIAEIELCLRGLYHTGFGFVFRREHVELLAEHLLMRRVVQVRRIDCRANVDAVLLCQVPQRDFRFLSRPQVHAEHQHRRKNPEYPSAICHVPAPKSVYQGS